MPINANDVREKDAQTENNYNDALSQLRQLIQNSNTIKVLSKNVEAVIAQVEALKRAGQEPVSELTWALNSTYQLLTDDKDMTVEEYKAVALDFQGGPSRGMQTLGGLMIALSISSLLIVLSPAAAIGLACGVGFFAKGSQQNGLSRAGRCLADMKVSLKVEYDIVDNGENFEI